MAEQRKLREEKLLKTEANEDLKKCLIEALDLSNENLKIIRKFRSFNSVGKVIKKYNTIGDLLKDGRSGIMATLSKTYMRYNDADALVSEIEQKLAKYGVKFADSDFTVLDVNISELEIGNKAKNFLEKLPSKIKTLSDLYIQNKNRIKSRILNDDRSIIHEIEKAMEKYGVKFLDSKYKLDKNNFFPKARYFRDKEKIIKKSLENSQSQKIDENKTKSVDVSSELYDIGLSTYNIQHLQDNLQVYTIADLLTKTHSSIFSALNRNIAAMSKIEIYYRKNNFQFPSKKVFLMEKTNKKEQINIFDLTDQGKQNLKTKSIEVLSMSNKTIERLKAIGVNVIADFEKITKTKFLIACCNSKSVCDKVLPLMQELEISFQQATRGVNYKIEIDIDDLDDEKTNNILNKPLSELGFGKVGVEKVKQSLEVETLNDLIKYPKSEISKVVNRNLSFLNQADYYIKKLNLNWVKKIPKSKMRENNKIEIHPVDVDTLDYEEKAKLMASDLTVIGLKKKLRNILNKQLNVETLEDLLKVNKSELRKALNHNNSQYYKIINNLSLFNLGLKSAKQARISNVEKEVNDRFNQLISEKIYNEPVINKESNQENSQEVKINNKEIKNLIDLTKQLEERGMWALYDLPDKYFVPGSQDFEDLKEIINAYSDKRFADLILSVQTEEALNIAEKRLQLEVSKIEKIIEQKQSGYKDKMSDLETKKTESLSGSKNNASNSMKRYYHLPNENKNIFEKKYYDNKTESQEFNM